VAREGADRHHRPEADDADIADALHGVSMRGDGSTGDISRLLRELPAA
jgi:hypothetical protein